MVCERCEKLQDRKNQLEQELNTIALQYRGAIAEVMFQLNQESEQHAKDEEAEADASET